MIGIYKIENLINNKVYIGQSRDIFKRWNSHKNTATNPNKQEYDYPLYRAFRKYGLKNFSFQVLEECSVEQLNEKENYWIKYYNSSGRLGYNQTELGYSQSGFKLTLDLVKEITDKLLYETNLSEMDIAKIYQVSNHTIKDINVGRTWFREDIDYPIRKTKEKEFYCKNCGKKVSKGNNICITCSSVLKRKVADRPSREELKEKIRKNSFISIGKEYGVSDNSIRKWCDSYNLPRRKNDINNYSDSEWEFV